MALNGHVGPLQGFMTPRSEARRGFALPRVLLGRPRPLRAGQQDATPHCHSAVTCSDGRQQGQLREVTAYSGPPRSLLGQCREGGLEPGKAAQKGVT